MMNPLLESLGIDRLTMDERIELADAIWETIDVDLDSAPFTPEQRDEIDRRLEAHRQNPEAAIPWEQVEAETLKRLGQ